MSISLPALATNALGHSHAAHASTRHARTLAYLVGSVMLASGIVGGVYPFSHLYMLPVLMLYSMLVYWRGPDLQQHLPNNAEQILLLVDALIAGAGIAALYFAPVPALMLLLMVCSTFISRSSLNTWLMGCVSLAVGLVIGVLVLHPHPLSHAATPTLLASTSVLGVGLVLCLSAYYTRQQAEDLLAAQQLLLLQQEQSMAISRKLTKYLSPQVWSSIFEGRRDAKLETRRKKLTVFFSDIKGFTEASDELAPDEFAEILNCYLEDMSRIALRHGGTIDKFIGDAIMIFYGDPTTRGAKEDAIACVSMALEMRKHMKLLRQKWQSRGIAKPLHVRMGINTGYCTVGNFGTELRMDYTIIGRDVNLASRLESVAESDEILVSHDTWTLVRDRITCREKGTVTVKGIAKPIMVYQVVDFRHELAGDAQFVEHEYDGFAMHLDISKIKNYDKDRIVESLVNAARKLKDKNIG